MTLDNPSVFLSRRNPSLLTHNVKQVLPEYFAAEYPNLVEFLETYYNFQASDSNHNFDQIVRDIYKIRDINSTDLAFLDSMFYEIGLGAGTEFFQSPRTVARLFAYIFKQKGSLTSTKMFFRAFFGEEVDIEYPKEQILTIGIHQIGPDFGYRIQDYEVYQIFSILIKAPIPVSRWRALYKKFAHPAGFFFSGQVVIEGIAELFDSAGELVMPTAILDSDLALDFEATASAFSLSSPSAEIVGITPDGSDSGDSATIINLNHSIAKYSSVDTETLESMYRDLAAALSVNSPTADDDSETGILPIRVDNTLETVDEDKWDLVIPSETGFTLPTLPSGFRFVVRESGGAYILDDSGNFVIAPIDVLPPLPVGYDFLTDSAGVYLTDSTGDAYLIGSNTPFPPLPAGFEFAQDEDGFYLLDENDNYIIIPED